MLPDPSQDAEDTARRLMRDGLGDEEIGDMTGLSMMRLLALRAGAAVEDRAWGSTRESGNPRPETHGRQTRDPEALDPEMLDAEAADSDPLA